MSRPWSRSSTAARAMFGLFRNDDDEYERPRRPDRSLSTRLAWLVLFSGAAVIVLRASLATVIEIHGDGMAPTLLDGDRVLLVRGAWGLGAGDLVIYEPTPPETPETITVAAEPSPDGTDDRDAGAHDPRKRSGDPLRNTAVIDVDDLDLDEEWAKVQRRSGLDDSPPPSSPLRVGRILAAPGDVVTLRTEGSAGIAVNGVELDHKAAGQLDIVRGRPDPSEAPAEVAAPHTRGSAFETIGSRRYRVLTTPGIATTWPGMGLPSDPGPVELVANGFLILADNRDDGACCDSRSLGFIPREQIRGEIVLRLGGSEHVPDDIDPRSRGLLWRP
jgi:signal peptidase I